MNDTTANPCVFCKGTGIEPGQTDCVWCENTGRDWGTSSPVVEAVNPSLLRDALEHIIKTVGQSRTQTRRLRWIGKRAELALAGRPYVAAEHELPVSSDSEYTKLMRQNMRLRAERNALQERLNDTDQRNAELEDLLSEAERSVDYHAGMQREGENERLYGVLTRIRGALKPTESGASEPVIQRVNEVSWTGEWVKRDDQ